MTRHLLWVVGLALAASLPPYQAAAQESAGTSGEATAETSQSQADTSGSASGSASAGQSDSGTSGSGSAQADAQASGSTSGQAGSQASSGTTSDSQPATSNGAANPSTTSGTSSAQNAESRNAEETSQDASAQSSTSTSGETTVPAPERPRTDSNQQGNQQDTTGRNDQAGASIQGRSRTDARTQQRNQENLQRGLHFGQATNRGLAIRDVDRNSIYFRSGFRRGDIIISLHGRPVHSHADFGRFIVLHPGQRVPVVVLRNGRHHTIYVDHPHEIVHTQHIHTPQAGGAYLGVLFNAQVRDAAVVLSVNPGSPAEEAGLQPGDSILAMNGQEVRSYPDVISMIRTMRPGQEVDIVIARGRSEMQVFAVLDARADVRTATRENVYIQPAPVPIGVEVEVNRRGNRPLLDRDRDNDGEPDGLLPRLLD